VSPFCCEICLYIYIYLHAVSYFLHLFCAFLRHSLTQKLFTNVQHTQRDGTNCHTSSMATARTKTTRGPTYSMTRAIGATPWQKGFTCRCHCCHYSPLTVEVTRHMDRPLQWPHLCLSMSARVPPQCRHILQSTWCARPCACSNHTDRA